MSTIDTIAVFHGHIPSDNLTPSSFYKFSPFFVKFRFKSRTETKVHVSFANSNNTNEWTPLTTMVLLAKQSVPIFQKEKCNDSVQDTFEDWKSRLVNWMDRNSFKPNYSLFTPSEEESNNMTQRLQQNASKDCKYVLLKFESEESIVYSTDSPVQSEFASVAPSPTASYFEFEKTNSSSSKCLQKQSKKKRKQIAMGRMYLFDCKDRIVIRFVVQVTILFWRHCFVTDFAVILMAQLLATIWEVIFLSF